jgi:8-amino-7-oxononanoate synthase
MNDLWKIQLQAVLQNLDQQQLRRVRGSHRWDGVGDHQVQPWLDFGNNDYLKLSQDPAVTQTLKDPPQQHLSGWGSGASPVLSGYSPAHTQLEQVLANLSETEGALAFSSGYACNVGSLAALLDDDCMVFSDQLNHASLIDGIRLSSALRLIYQHNNLQHLEQLLRTHRHQRTRAVIVSESVFSMDGDEAPLLELVEIAERFNCGLVIDEAHAVGVFGSGGGGLLEELHLSNKILLKLGTLSKAIGGIGGYAAGTQLIIDFLINRCRSYIFSTAAPALAMSATITAVQRLVAMQLERTRLQELSLYAREKLRELGWNISCWRSPIIPVIVGSAQNALQLAQRLREQRIYVPAIRPPTVPQDSCRLRISLNVGHSRADIDRLARAIGLATQIAE